MGRGWLSYASGALQHVGDEARRDGGAALVLLVLARVGEVGDDGSDAAGAGGAAGVDHNEHLHQAVVDVAGRGGLKDEDCESLDPWSGHERVGP